MHNIGSQQANHHTKHVPKNRLQNTHSRQQTEDIPNKTFQYTITETNMTDTLKPQTAFKHMMSPFNCEKQADLNTAHTNIG